MKRNNVKLLIQRHRSAAADSNGADIIQNSNIHVIEANVYRDGLRAVDSGEFLIPTGVPVSEGDIVKWIQDDADVTHLRSCYLFQGSLRDEGGWEADGTNPDEPVWTHVGSSDEVGGDSGQEPLGADKFKGLLRINKYQESGYKISKIPNKLMYVNKTVSGGTTTANVHDFNGDFEIDIWVTADNGISETKVIFCKGNSYGGGQRVSIYQGTSGEIRADVEDGNNNEVQLTTGSKIQKTSSANFIRFQRKGHKFSLWLINGSEPSSTLFNTPDDTETNSLMENITTTTPTVLAGYWTGSSLQADYTGIVHSVRIYCGGVLSLGDARALYKARATPLVMKLAGTVWKIKDMTNGKKLYVTGFGKVIPETNMDTNILDSGTEDSSVPEGNDSLNRVKNVYKEEHSHNIIYSMFKKLNVANTASAGSSATNFNNFIIGWATPNEAANITEFVAEGNLLSLIKILMVRAVQQSGSLTGGTNYQYLGDDKTYSFFISPRGVVVVESLGINRGITFNHDPYNIQVSAADDTYVANDITVYGRIPINTFVRNESSQALSSAITFTTAEIGTAIPLAVRIYDNTQSEWLSADSTNPQFTVDREGRSVTITSWESGSGSHNVDIHVDYEYINTGASTPNVRQFVNDTSITNIGRYKKKIFVPQLTNGADILIFGSNLLGLSKNINKRYTIKAPFLVNFIRENHEVTVKNTLKNINATNQIVKSIHWHYPKNETIIEVGEHEANSYDLVVGANETISALTSQTLKSMNR